MSKNETAFMWCTECGVRLTEAETVGLKKCPKCGSVGIPCSAEKDFLIEVNWHELRILGIWASNWANERCEEGAKKTLLGILRRLERQAPSEAPLTMGGELRELQRAMASGQFGPNASVESHNIAPDGLVVVHGPGAVGFGRRPGGA